MHLIGDKIVPFTISDYGSLIPLYYS